VFEFKAKKEPRQKRSKATYEAILDACAQLLEEMGYQQLTTNHIAERAGVSVGSLYEYFDNKEVIVHLMLHREIDSILEEAGDFSDIEHDDLLSLIQKWLWKIYNILLKRQRLYYVIFNEVPHEVKAEPVNKIQDQQILIMKTTFSLLGDQLTIEQQELNENIFIMVSIIDSVLTRLVLHPWQEADPEKVLNILARRIYRWAEDDRMIFS